MIGRLIGWLFLGLALVCLGADAMAMLERGRFALLSLHELWSALAPAGLSVAEQTVRQYTVPFLWDPVAITLLKVPGVILFGILGLLCLILFHRREGRNHKFA